MIKAVFPGSFDPPTYGHLNIIERSRALFSELDVVIAFNQNKKFLFSEEERLELMNELVSPWENVNVHLCSSLIVDYAKKVGAQVLIRGIRNFSDFSYEFDLSLLNRGLNKDVETFFLATDPEFFVLKSSAIKELAYYKGDVSTMVPPIVEKALKKKFNS